MTELGEKVRASIQRIKTYSHLDDKGYYLAFSGGKDSVVCKALLEMAGVKYDAHYRGRSLGRECQSTKEPGQHHNLRQKAGKELADDSNFQSTDRGGVVLVNDNVESRRTIEQCLTRLKTVLNPIIEWTDRDVWEFIKAENIPYCGLYDCGFRRLGCIGCPMAMQHGREIEFARWPKYEWHYRHAFEKMLELRRERHEKDPSRTVWRAKAKDNPNATVEDVWRWWLELPLDDPGGVSNEP